MTNISESQLIESGYRKYDTAQMSTFRHADYLFQKRVLDAQKRTLYFIDIWQYDGLYTDACGGDGWMPEVQLYTGEGKARTVNLTLGSFESLEEVESFIEKAYRALECVPYEDAE